MISPCGFDFNFSDDLWCWAFFSCTHWPCGCLVSSARFEIRLFAFLNYWIVWVFIYLDVDSLLEYALQKSSHGCLLILSIISFPMQNALTWCMLLDQYHSFCYYGLIILFEIRKCNTSGFVSFHQSALVIQGLL